MVVIYSQFLIKVCFSATIAYTSSHHLLRSCFIPMTLNRSGVCVCVPYGLNLRISRRPLDKIKVNKYPQYAKYIRTGQR